MTALRGESAVGSPTGDRCSITDSAKPLVAFEGGGAQGLVRHARLLPGGRSRCRRTQTAQIGRSKHSVHGEGSR